MSALITPGEWHVKVREARKAKGISQQAIAKSTGIRQPRISQIENGLVDPRLSEVLSISKALELAIASFPASFTESVEYTIWDCEILEERKHGSPTIPQLILGDRAPI